MRPPVAANRILAGYAISNSRVQLRVSKSLRPAASFYVRSSGVSADPLSILGQGIDEIAVEFSGRARSTTLWARIAAAKSATCLFMAWCGQRPGSHWSAVIRTTGIGKQSTRFKSWAGLYCMRIELLNTQRYPYGWSFCAAHVHPS